MANPSISTFLPDPFRNNFNQLRGLANITHVPSNQYVPVTGAAPSQNGVVAPLQLTSPIRVQPDSVGAITLPTADEVVNIFRNSVPPVVVGDVFGVPVYNLGSTGAVFVTGTGGSGTVTVDPISSTVAPGQLVVQVTSLDPSVGLSYTLQ